MAVVIAVGLADGELLIISQDIGGSHVIRKIADIHFCGDKLHGDIIADRVNGNGGILPDFACDTVVKTVFQPLCRLRLPGMIPGSLKTFQGSGINAPVEGSVVRAHVIPEHSVELRQGSNGTDVKGIKPALLQGAEMAFHLAFAGPVTDLCMEKQHPEGHTDHGKLFIGVAAAVVDVELIRDTIGGNGGLEDLLEVTGIVIIEQSAADQESGMVINDHDAVDTSGLTVFRDVWEVTGIRLPDLAEFVLFIGLTVPEIRIPG